MHEHTEANVKWTDQLQGFRQSDEYRELSGIDGEPIEFEWNLFPGLATLQKVSSWSNQSRRLETRIIFMSMFNRVRQNLRTGRFGKRCNKKGAPRSLGLGEKCPHTSQGEEETFYSPAEAWVRPAASSTIRNRLLSVYALAEQKRSKPRRTGYPSKVKEPHNGDCGQWRSANQRGCTGFRSRILISS